MRKYSSFFVAMAMCMLLTGCKAGMGTTLGMALGGAAGGFIPQAFGPNVSPVIQAVAPIAGAAIGGGVGYAIDSASADEEQQIAAQKEQQKMQMHQAQYQQQQLQQLQQTTRLSAPVVVVTGNNQGLPARNGAELANVLVRMQPGTQFGVITKKANAPVVMQDMAGNGYVALGAPKPQGKNVFITFQKPATQATPMPLNTALNAL